MEKRLLDKSNIQDVKQTKYEDLVPELLVRLFPYRAINGNKDKTFLREETHTLVSISQDSVKEFEDYKVDEDSGDKYIEIISSSNSDSKLSVNLNNSKTLDSTKKIIALSKTNIKEDEYKFDFFTFKEPFDEIKWKNKEQPIFYATDINNGMDEEELNEVFNDFRYLNSGGPSVIYNLTNVLLLEEEVSGARLHFTRNTNVAIDPLNEDGEFGISIETDNFSPLNNIIAKGIMNGDYSNIDFIRKGAIMPLMINIKKSDEKIIFELPWNDYNFAIPYFGIEKFIGTPKPISEWIDHVDDRKLFEDMIIISFGFVNNWNFVPRYKTSDTNIYKNVTPGDIRFDAYIGHQGIPIASIAKSSEVRGVLDGLYRAHIFKNPNYKDTSSRVQKLQSAIVALSGYIYSSLAVAGGGNNYNEIILPWFLKPSFDSRIEATNNKQKVLNQEGSLVNTFLLPGTEYNANGTIETKETTIKFIAKTFYFKNKLGDPKDMEASETFQLPTNIEVSNPIQLRTDRVIDLPQVEDVYDEKHKIKIPGDIDLSSDEELKYLFYLPIKETEYKKFYLNTSSIVNTIKKGETITLYPPRNDINNRKNDVGDIMIDFNDGLNGFKNYIITRTITEAYMSSHPDLYWLFIGFILFDKIYNTGGYNSDLAKEEIKKIYAKSLDKNITDNFEIIREPISTLTAQQEYVLEDKDIVAINTKVNSEGIYFNKRASFIKNKKVFFGSNGNTRLIKILKQLKEKTQNYETGIFKEVQYIENNKTYKFQIKRANDKTVYNLKIDDDFLREEISKNVFGTINKWNGIRIKENNIIIRYQAHTLVPINNPIHDFEKEYTKDIKIEFFGNFKFETLVQSFNNLQIKLKKDIQNIKVESFTNRQSQFNKKSFKNFLNDFNFLPTGKQKYNLSEKNGEKITNIYEIEIHDLINSKITLFFEGGNIKYEFDFKSKFDERIAEKRIAFY